MSQALAEELAKKFTEISGIQCTATFFNQGENHKPTTLATGWKGVYVFLLTDNVCLKVGKADQNSKARWNSHHYSLDGTTPSTLTKSFLSDLDNFKSFFDSADTKAQIDEFKSIITRYIPNTSNFKTEIKHLGANNVKQLSTELKLKEWIRENMSRIEFLIPGDASCYGLTLLEAFIQFKLNPIYEGSNA
jgi:hypothetical protein